jgi:hypothetical protein
MDLNNDLYHILIFSIFDLVIGILLAKMLKTFNNKEKTNNYVEIIYLFNPISILNCSRLNLNIFYNMLNLIFFSSNNFFFYLLYFLTSCCTPQYFIMNTIFMLIKSIRNKNYLPVVLTFTALVIITIKTDLLILYKNYFYVKDTLPNLNMIWSLLPEVF